MLSARGLEPHDHGIIAIVLSILFGIQMTYTALFYIGAQTFITQVSNKSIIRSQLAFINALISFPICAIIFLILVYFSDTNDIGTILLASLFIYSQVLADHCRQEVFIFEIKDLQVVLIIASFLIKVIGIYYSTDIDTSLLILLLSNIFFLPRFFRLISIDNFIGVNDLNGILMHLVSCRKITIAALINWFWGFFPIYLMGYFHGVALSGVLLTLRSIANIHQPVSSLFDSYILHELNRTKKSDRRAYKSRIDRIALLFWVLIFVILLLYGKELLEYILSEKYNFFSPHLAVLWGASGFFILTKNTHCFLRINDKNLLVEQRSSIVAMVIVILIGTPLVFYKQITGAVILYLLASFCYFLYSYWKYNGRRVCERPQ